MNNEKTNQQSARATMIVVPVEFSKVRQMISCPDCQASASNNCYQLPSDSWISHIQLEKNDNDIVTYAFNYCHKSRVDLYYQVMAFVPCLSNSEFGATIELDSDKLIGEILESTYCGFCKADIDEQCIGFYNLPVTHSVHAVRFNSYEKQQKEKQLFVGIDLGRNESQTNQVKIDYANIPQEFKLNYVVSSESLMTLNDYQAQAKEFAFYPKRNKVGGLSYVALKLNGEAGEVAEKIGKLIRDNQSKGFDTKVSNLDSEFRLELAKELSDVLWYIQAGANELGYQLSDIAKMNLDKLQSRKERNKLSGFGDNR